MPIAFLCHYCGRRLEFPRSKAGQSVSCACGVAVTVPRPETVPRRKAPPKAKAPARQAEAPPKDTPAHATPPALATIAFNCNHCRKRFTVPLDMIGQKGRCTCGLAYVVPRAADAKAKGKPAKVEPKSDKPKTPSRKSHGREIVFNCPRCKRRIALPTIQAGRKANCTCGARFVVPVPGGHTPKDLNDPAAPGLCGFKSEARNPKH